MLKEGHELDQRVVEDEVWC